MLTRMERTDTIPHVVLSTARARPDHPAVVAEDGNVTTYAELAEAAWTCAAAMVASGVQAGDRVALWAPNRPEWIVATLGLQIAGAVLVPVSTRLKALEVRHILSASGTTRLIGAEAVDGHPLLPLIDGERVDGLLEAVSLDDAPGRTAWSAFLARGNAADRAEAERRLDALRPGDVSDVIYTSGTTGAPKGVMTGHGQNVATFRIYGNHIAMGPTDRYLVVNPFFHTFGYKAGWLTSFIAGATVYPQAVFDAATVLRRIEAERITVMPGPPTLFHSLIHAPDRSDYDLSSLRATVTGAATVPLELVEEMRSDLGFDMVLTAYGLTEACGVVTMCRPDDPAELIARTAGRAITDVEVKLVDGDGATVPPGDPGELLVRGPNVMLGYLNDPEATARAIDADGWLHTGDIATSDAAGYVTITDRKNDMLIVGGFNAYPAEIERLMGGHPAIQQSAVVGVPDARMGEVPVAYVMLRPGCAADPAEIVAWCRANMANYKAPRRVTVVDAMPLNAAGKVQRFVLRERALNESGANQPAG
jgi:acyl-CoA synthetase (AMP-forming)/AMP-acid ligase II